MSTDVDVIVVGGGPAGLASAIEGRMLGLSVAVIEPRAGEIDKACGEGLMPGAIPALERIGVFPEGQPLRGVRYCSGDTAVDYRFRGQAGLGVRRTTLSEALSARADELGVERIPGRVKSIEQHSDRVGVGMAECESGMTARYLVAADGLHSTSRRLAGLEGTARDRLLRGKARYGIRQHFAVEPWSDLIEVHWTPVVEAYVTPVDAGTVGVAVLGARHTDFDAAIASIPALAGRLAGREPVSTRRGAGPFRQRAARRTSGRVLLVGDASGYVDAITGEGIRLSLAQARAALAAIAAGEPARYERDWLRVTRDFRMLTAGLVAAATSPVRPLIVPAAAALPRVFGAVVQRLAH